MANTWIDITSDPAWDDFSPEQKNLVREHFYNSVVAPTADPDGQAALRQQFEQLTAPSMVQKRNVGYGESIRRDVMGGLSGTETFLRTLPGAVPAIYDAARGLFTGKNESGASDWYFKNVVQPSVDYGET